MTSSEVELNPGVENIHIQEHRLSQQDIWLAFVPVVLVIHIWSLLHVFEEAPAWINRFTSWEVLGAIAYTQVFALLESIFILALFLIAGFVLPRRWFASRFVPMTSMLVFLMAGWAIAAQKYDKLIRESGPKDFLPWLIVVAVSFVFAWVLVSRSEKLRRFLYAFADRASVLAIVYLFIDALSLIIVLFRNL